MEISKSQRFYRLVGSRLPRRHLDWLCGRQRHETGTFGKANSSALWLGGLRDCRLTSTPVTRGVFI